MLEALDALALWVGPDKVAKIAIVFGYGSRFLIVKDAKEEVQYFSGGSSCWWKCYGIHGNDLTLAGRLHPPFPRILQIGSVQVQWKPTEICIDRSELYSSSRTANRKEQWRLTAEDLSIDLQ